MSFTQRIIKKLETNLWTHVKVVHTTNHDYPYHDYIKIDNEEGQETIVGSYPVGKSNIDAHGDQHKFFVSKRTLISCRENATFVKFNDSKNVEVHPRLHQYEPTATIYFLRDEYHTNINVVHYSVAVGDILYMYFEGVLPEEARDAE